MCKDLRKSLAKRSDDVVVKKGCFAKAGDFVCEGWDTETRSIAPPYMYGLVIEVFPRSPEAYTAEQIAEAPIRNMKILTTTGQFVRRYSVHVEVISESR